MSSEMEKLLQEEEQNYEEVYRGSIVKGYVETGFLLHHFELQNRRSFTAF